MWHKTGLEQLKAVSIACTLGGAAFFLSLMVAALASGTTIYGSEMASEWREIIAQNEPMVLVISFLLTGIILVFAALLLGVFFYLIPIGLAASLGRFFSVRHPLPYVTMTTVVYILIWLIRHDTLPASTFSVEMLTINVLPPMLVGLVYWNYGVRAVLVLDRE